MGDSKGGGGRSSGAKAASAGPKLSGQIAGRMKKLAAAEEAAAFKSYTSQTFSKAEKLLGEKISNRKTVMPLLQQAYDKGISPARLAELLAASSK